MAIEKELYRTETDLRFNDPYEDIEEDRERVLRDGTVIPFHYIHGGFAQMSVKFSLCLPQKDSFTGRFFQILSPFPGPDEEMASLQLTGDDDWVGFSLRYGAAFVESNMGSKQAFGPKEDDTIVWKSSAQVAEYVRKRIMDYYGCERPVGIVYGGSGGGYKTMACIENTTAWDGAVPFVIGSPASLPNTITMHVQGLRVLRNCLGKITENLDAGGSGNMYDGLNEDEEKMLREMTRMGYPPRAWYLAAWEMDNDGSLPVLMPGIRQKDPGYFKDFWEVPGYLGADPESDAAKDRIQFETLVREVHVPGTEEEKAGFDSRNDVDNAWQKMLTDGKDAWIEVESIPALDNLYINGTQIVITSGEAASASLTLDKIIPAEGKDGGALTIGMVYGTPNLQDLFAKIKPGDSIRLDNSDYIAVQSYYRHQVPADLSFHAWDQFRNEDGTPAIPQRDTVIGYGFTGTGTVQDGNIQCKTIVVQSLMDESTCPWCADWYRHKVIESRGSEENFRVYYNDRCMHGPIEILENSQVTNYGGILRQAILDVSEWALHGTLPPASTNYKYDDGQIIVPDDAAQRGGMQQSIRFTVNGSDCAHIKAGETVNFDVETHLPEAGGEITAVDYDFVEKRGVAIPDIFSTRGDFTRTAENGVKGAVSTISHVYDTPGTYYASVRVMSQRDGNAAENFTQIRNIARAKIVVS
ncbi:MAG: hypothetical protein IJV14_06110 [Lachnospiraceae bacterium]|nr:hypothetical protein [Lachnospiraceae bacterium]